MEKSWIDKEGRLRVTYDENYQMVMPVPFDEIWNLTDSWDIDLAGRLIVLGYNLDLKETIEYGLKECPYGTTGRDQADALITVMDRFFTLAKAAIAIGVIKEHDTPANWMKWAKSKGYSIAHLVKAPAQVETERPQLKGMSKLDIARAFDGIHFKYDEWDRNLADFPKWLEPCLVSRGSKKRHLSHLWNPVLIALALMDKPRYIPLKRLDLVFIGLKDWQSEWQDKSEYWRN